MGKYEAKPQKAERAAGGGNKKKHIGLWITLAVLVVLGIYAVWFFTSAPDNDVIGDNPSQEALPGNDVVVDPDNPQQGSDPENPGAQEPIAEPREMKKGVYTILLAGTVDSYNTDTMMLCYVDTNTDKVKLVSINRDTQIYAPANVSIPKINGAYGWGEKREETMCQKVTEVTGVPINYYVVINMNSFKRVIDLIGGVDYNVPFDMVHRDADEKFDINLAAGWQNLDGSEALQFVRFRSTSENDFGRVNRQKDFLVATVKQVLQKFSLSQIEDYIGIFNENVKTNMSVQNMVWFFLNVVTDLDFDEDLSTDTLPYASTGYYKKNSYIYLDPQQVVDYVNANLNPYTTDITVNDVHIPHLED